MLNSFFTVCNTGPDINLSRPPVSYFSREELELGNFLTRHLQDAFAPGGHSVMKCLKYVRLNSLQDKPWNKNLRLRSVFGSSSRKHRRKVGTETS